MSDTDPTQRNGSPAKRNTLALIAAIVLAFAVSRACQAEPKQSTEELAQSISSEATKPQTTSRKPAPETKAKAETKKDAMGWLTSQFGAAPSEVLVQDPSIWYGYVTGAYVEHGNLHVQLQVDRKADKALGEQAAKALASFVTLSDDPVVDGVDWAIAEDGTGVIIKQEKVNRR